MSEYKHPEVLVTTAWAVQNLNAPNTRFVEVDVDNTAIMLYGDNNNWFAAYAFWQLKLYGHKDVRLINGGRNKWLEEKRPLTKDVPNVSPTTYRVSATDASIRAFKEDVSAVVEGRKSGQLVDVRSVDEFTGKIIAPPGMSETAQRAGHIPKAANIPW